MNTEVRKCWVVGFVAVAGLVACGGPLPTDGAGGQGGMSSGGSGGAKSGGAGGKSGGAAGSTGGGASGGSGSMCVPNCSGKQCGGDGCSGSCGSCSFGTCTASGHCQLLFSNAWQAFPWPASAVEFRCAGTVLEGGMKCGDVSGGMGTIAVELRYASGTAYPMLINCDGVSYPTDYGVCGLSISPAGATFAAGTDPANLLCQAMGWGSSNNSGGCAPDSGGSCIVPTSGAVAYFNLSSNAYAIGVRNSPSGYFNTITCTP